MTDYGEDLPTRGPPPYVMPGNPTAEAPFATIYPPPIQGLAVAFFTPRMAPTPVATRLPQPSKTQDTVNGFLRVEAAGGAIQADALLFNCSIILHSYAPNNQESQAEIVMMSALAHGGNAQGRFITHPSLQRPWYVTFSSIRALAVKQADPLVNLTRFRAMITWRIQGSFDPHNQPPNPE